MLLLTIREVLLEKYDIERKRNLFRSHRLMRLEQTDCLRNCLRTTYFSKPCLSPFAQNPRLSLSRSFSHCLPPDTPFLPSSLGQCQSRTTRPSLIQFTQNR